VTVPNVGIEEPLAARSAPVDCEILANNRGKIERQDPVSIKNAKDVIGRIVCGNLAIKVKRPQQKGSLGSAALTGDDISFFEKHNHQYNV